MTTTTFATAATIAAQYNIGFEPDSASPSHVSTAAIRMGEADSLASQLREAGFSEVSTARDNDDPTTGWVYVTIPADESETTTMSTANAATRILRTLQHAEDILREEGAESWIGVDADHLGCPVGEHERGLRTCPATELRDWARSVARDNR